MKLITQRKFVFQIRLLYKTEDKQVKVKKIYESFPARTVGPATCDVHDAQRVRKKKLLPFPVAKISFLLFLAYVGTVYMLKEVSGALWGGGRL